MIDLHSHTTASDGQHTPTELVRLAAEAGVRHLSVTDHDTVAGLAEAFTAARSAGLEVVPGIELSAFVGKKEVHVLGHFVDSSNARLAEVSRLLRTEREGRMAKMVDRMRALGYPVTLADVQRVAGDAQLGRPHLALVLVDKRYCTSTKEAFDRFLGDGRPAWVDRYRLSAADAVALIRDSGGAATLAHPGVSRVEAPELEQLKAVGLAGLEVYHLDHNPSMREKLLRLAAALDLVPTAGSDFHGERVAPGRRLGSTSMPQEAFDALARRAGRT